MVIHRSKEILDRNLHKVEKINILINLQKNFLNKWVEIYSSIEVGANLNISLDFLKILFPKCKIFGIEINKKHIQY